MTRLTSLPVLALSFLAVTLLAMGPLQGLDIALNRSYPDPPIPGWRFFSKEMLDRVAGQAVAVPVLAAVAGALAWRRRSWQPLAVAALAEVCVMGLVGLAKLATARQIPHSTEEDFFTGGFLEFGRHGISFPSGHAAEAVGLYGAVVLLLCWYGPVSRRTARWLWIGVGVITAATALNSLHLGYHWATDLLGGVTAGALALRFVEQLARHRLVPDPDRSPAVPAANVPATVAAVPVRGLPVGVAAAEAARATVATTRTAVARVVAASVALAARGDARQPVRDADQDREPASV